MEFVAPLWILAIAICSLLTASYHSEPMPDGTVVRSSWLSGFLCGLFFGPLGVIVVGAYLASLPLEERKRQAQDAVIRSAPAANPVETLRRNPGMRVRTRRPIVRR